VDYGPAQMCRGSFTNRLGIAGTMSDTALSGPVRLQD
jgi:hypothetical protein